MNNVIKKLIKRKNCLSECQRKSGNLNYANLNSIAQDASNAVNPSKLKDRECLQFFLLRLYLRTHGNCKKQFLIWKKNIN